MAAVGAQAPKTVDIANIKTFVREVKLIGCDRQAFSGPCGWVAGKLGRTFSDKYLSCGMGFGAAIPVNFP